MVWTCFLRIKQVIIWIIMLIEVKWRQLTSVMKIDVYWRQLTTVDDNWRQLTTIDDNWRQITLDKIDACVKFRQLSSKKNFTFFNFSNSSKTSNNVKKCWHSSKASKNVITDASSQLTLNDVNWRQRWRKMTHDASLTFVILRQLLSIYINWRH